MKHINATATTSERRELKVLGIDLAKQSFQLHGVDDQGHVVLRKKLNRNQLNAFIANLPPCLIGLENRHGVRHGVIYGLPRIARKISFVTKRILLPYIRPLIAEEP